MGFENFPYTNFHELNLDWIAKIAKDFLEQYTQIQETITTGLEDLDNKAAALQALLDEWYNTHSADIANQLAAALADLESWYTTHENYLDSTLAENIALFQTAAENKATETLASIPADYTTLYNTVQEHIKFNKQNSNISAGVNVLDLFHWLTESGVTFTKNNNTYTIQVNSLLHANPFVFSDVDIPVTFTADYTINSGSNIRFEILNANDTVVATFRPDSIQVSAIGSKLRMDYGSSGQITLNSAVLKNTQYSNEAATNGIDVLSADRIDEKFSESIIDLQTWLTRLGVTFTRSGQNYEITSSGYMPAIPYKFSDIDIPVRLSGKIIPITAENVCVVLLDRNNKWVNMLTIGADEVTGIASSMIIYYGASGTFRLNSLMIRNWPEVSDSLSTSVNMKHDTAFPVAFPDDFTFRPAFLRRLYTDGKGTFFLKNFNMRDYSNKGSGRDYYVSPDHGNDSAYDGLSLEFPFRTFNKAYSMSDVRTIYLAPGIYPREVGMWLTENISKSINIIALGKVFMTNSYATEFSESGLASVVYTETTIKPTTVIDINRKDPVTDSYIILTEAPSLTECYDTPDSWYFDSTRVYIHNAGEYIAYCRNILLTRDDPPAIISGQNNVYISGITFIGGGNAIRIIAQDANNSPTVYAENCEFHFGSGTLYRDCVSVRGARRTIFKNCSARFNKAGDGFNYHSYLGIIPEAVEINCIGMYNGDDSDGSDQGSTAHDGVQIVRINGVYAFNKGANVAEEGEATRSWNLGCVCFDSKSPYNSQNSNFMAYERATMYLDGCKGYSSLGNIAGTLDNVYIRNPEFHGELKSPEATGTEHYY